MRLVVLVLIAVGGFSIPWIVVGSQIQVFPGASAQQVTAETLDAEVAVKRPSARSEYIQELAPAEPQATISTPVSGALGLQQGLKSVRD